MLISDSMALLWLTYIVLSLVVLGSGYLGLAFLPRLPRLIITWMVAGVMWMPSRFRLPLLEEGEFYTGFAPAVMVAGVALLEGNTGSMVPAAVLVVIGALAGCAVGVAIWWRGRRSTDTSDTQVEERTASPPPGGKRREPMIG
jgi:NhaP-type Na+/H+ or K+/H+ antiporter